MRRIFRSFTFYLCLLSVFAIYTHYIGQDPKSIVLISLNPILKRLSYIDAARNFLNSGPKVYGNTILGEFSIYWYIAHFGISAFWGIVLDAIKATIAYHTKKKKE